MCGEARKTRGGEAPRRLSSSRVIVTTTKATSAPPPPPPATALPKPPLTSVRRCSSALAAYRNVKTRAAMPWRGAHLTPLCNGLGRDTYDANTGKKPTAACSAQRHQHPAPPHHASLPGRLGDRRPSCWACLPPAPRPSRWRLPSPPPTWLLPFSLQVPSLTLLFGTHVRRQASTHHSAHICRHAAVACVSGAASQTCNQPVLRGRHAAYSRLRENLARCRQG